MRRHPRLVSLLWRWHRRLGLFAALFALLLAISGIVLNHSAGLGLDRAFVESPLVRHLYGDRSDEVRAFQLGEHWLSRAANGRLYFDATEVAPCRGEMVGALATEPFLVAACAEEILLLTPGGQLIESVTASTGLPVPLAGVGLVADAVAVQSGETWWLADLEAMSFARRAPGSALVSQLTPGALPANLARALPAPEQWLSWERVLLDLHSGRLAGRAGVLLVDGVGLLLCILGLSGIAMWWLHRRGGRHRA